VFHAKRSDARAPAEGRGYVADTNSLESLRPGRGAARAQVNDTTRGSSLSMISTAPS
jgi:hypothetical protein